MSKRLHSTRFATVNHRTEGTDPVAAGIQQLQLSSSDSLEDLCRSYQVYSNSLSDS